jgi:serine/threonine-protein kinase
MRRIGEGGMGVVVEAENVVTGKRVAIKWMHPQIAVQPEAIERFLREARATARVRHPNVVDVYDAVHENDTCFLVMELLEGEPLSALMSRGDTPAHRIVALLLEAMRGVASAHAKGVVHRDIKPDNIFLAVEPERASCVPKVLDFGISKLIDPQAVSLTRTGTALGTPVYMSFEQLCGVKDVDGRTDVYGFGVVLYEALTGRLPFDAPNLPQLVAKLSRTVPPSLRELRPDVPEGLARVVARAMAKERDARFGSLAEMITALEPYANPEAYGSPLRAASAVLPVSSTYDRGASAEWAAVPTPMLASGAIPAAPRKREALAWLVVAGIVATIVGALTAYARLQPEAATTDTSAATSGESAGPVPTPAVGAATAPPPTAAKEVQAAKTPAPAKRAVEARASRAARPAPVSAPAAPATPTATSSEQPPAAAEASGEALPERPIASPPREYRAGRPRSEDF